MDANTIKKMKYVGTGFFRTPAPKGTPSPTIHAPEMRDILITEIERLRPFETKLKQLKVIE